MPGVRVVSQLLAVDILPVPTWGPCWGLDAGIGLAPPHQPFSARRSAALGQCDSVNRGSFPQEGGLRAAGAEGSERKAEAWGGGGPAQSWTPSRAGTAHQHSRLGMGFDF